MVEKTATLSNSVIHRTAGMLARAFHNNPFYRYALPGERSRTQPPALLSGDQQPRLGQVLSETWLYRDNGT